MVKAIPASQLQDPDTEKSQNHHPHSTNGDKADSDTVTVDVFRWSRCKKPLPQKVMRAVGIPLPLEYVEVFLNRSILYIYKMLIRINCKRQIFATYVQLLTFCIF